MKEPVSEQLSFTKNWDSIVNKHDSQYLDHETDRSIKMTPFYGIFLSKSWIRAVEFARPDLSIASVLRILFSSKKFVENKLLHACLKISFIVINQNISSLILPSLQEIEMPFPPMPGSAVDLAIQKQPLPPGPCRKQHPYLSWSLAIRLKHNSSQRVLPSG